MSEGRDEGAMPGALLDLDYPPSWPVEPRACLDEHHDLFPVREIKK